MVIEGSVPIVHWMLGLPILLILMFLPTVIELKKPKDVEPRMIFRDIFEGIHVLSPSLNLTDLEEKCGSFPSASFLKLTVKILTSDELMHLE